MLQINTHKQYMHYHLFEVVSVNVQICGIKGHHVVTLLRTLGNVGHLQLCGLDWGGSSMQVSNKRD